VDGNFWIIKIYSELFKAHRFFSPVIGMCLFTNWPNVCSTNC
jgi:hypothetical protein